MEKGRPQPFIPWSSKNVVADHRFAQKRSMRGVSNRSHAHPIVRQSSYYMPKKLGVTALILARFYKQPPTALTAAVSTRLKRNRTGWFL